MSFLQSQLEAILPLVSKPTRYLGNEFHVMRKTPTKDMVQWCLLLPEVYEIGMSHWGLKILYEILNRRPDALAERCFAPWFDMEAQLRRHGIPLFALESKRPIREFDFVGFSMQYELTYTNVLQCLDLAGIPMRAEDRGENDPLVVAGGPVTSNPEPLSDFIDIFLIGDGEEAVPRLTSVYKQLRGMPRHQILREIAKVPGYYVPLMYEATYDATGKHLGTSPRYADVPKRVLRQFIVDLENAPVPSRPVVPLQGIVQDRLSIEVLRGCTQGCRFCQAGYLYRPIRERSVEKILEIADEGIKASGWDEIGLTSLSTADYTQLEPLADVLNNRFRADRIALSLPSLRADSFGVEIADKVRETKRTGFTFAPEVGSERLRLAVNKLIKNREFYDAAEIAYSRGWNLIKMYFMVGLPTETWEDVDGIVDFVQTVREIGFRHSKRNTVTASVGSFVPKSHTPFQWDAFEPTALLEEKIRYIRGKCHSRWSRVKWHDVKTSHLEAIFSLGDRRLGPAIQHAYEEGARFDGWTEHFNYRRWMRAFSETGIDPDMYTKGRGFEDALPWDHIDIRVSKKWLERERKKTEEAVLELGESLTADCRHGDCTACGIPGLPYDTQLTASLEPAELDRILEKASGMVPSNAVGARKAMALPNRKPGVAGASTSTTSDVTGNATAIETPPIPDEPDPSFIVRIQYEKLGLTRFLSHLETGTVLTRAFRMANVPLAHTRGHVPRPKLSFGPSLSVGIETEVEAFDIELVEPWDPRLADALNRVLPEGMRVLQGVPIERVPGVRLQSLAAIARRAKYRIELDALPESTLAQMRETVLRFRAEDTLIVPRSFWSPGTSREIADWEGPMEVQAASHSTTGPETGDSGADRSPADRPQSDRPGADRLGVNASDVGPSNSDPSGTGSSDKSSRTVDLSLAIHAITLENRRLDLDLYLSRPDGQVANPKVILERLFGLSPEEHAKVRIVRSDLLTESGEAVVPPLLEELPAVT